MEEKFKQVLKIAQGHTVCIQTHDYPDPDALASAYGLQELLRRRGIEAEIGYFGTVDKINIRLMMEEFDIRPMSEQRRKELDEDTVIINVDVQKNNSNLTDMRGKERVCIDHHPWVTNAEYDIVIHKIVGSCATIVTQMYEELGEEIPTMVATALIYGLKVDTRNLCSGVTDDDIAAFAKLHRLADHSIIRRLENSSLQISDLRAYGAAIQGIEVHGGIGFVHIPFDCPDGLIASVCNFILALDTVKIAVVYADRRGGMKFSVRSEERDVNAGQLISCALEGVGNGGGHYAMAGGILWAESVPLLGDDIDLAIRNRFSETLHEIRD